MFKKVLSLAIALTMVVSMFCGCSTQSAQTTETKAEVETAASNQTNADSNVKKGAVTI